VKGGSVLLDRKSAQVDAFWRFVDIRIRRLLVVRPANRRGSRFLEIDVTFDIRDQS
jgi:hypothetical protein